MFFNEEFIKLYEELSELTEAKADTDRLIAFAGQALADRFLALKNKLKSPENDLYYWIKNKTPEDLEAFISEMEGTKSKTQAKKDTADRGAKLVQETAHWKIYEITTFEASQKYGRDTQWCITGVNTYGDHYWNDYRDKGVDFYFLITKGEYNPRGDDSKIAIAVYSDYNAYEIFDQQDRPLQDIEDVPYYTEINIPGIDFYDMSANAPDIDDGGYCERCGNDFGDDYYISPYGEFLCDSCFHDHFCFCSDCEEVLRIDDTTESAYGERYCNDCWEKYIDTEEAYVDYFIVAAEDDGNGYFEDCDYIDEMIAVWVKAKEAHLLNLSADEIAKYEERFINSAAKDGVTIDPERFVTTADTGTDMKVLKKTDRVRGAVYIDGNNLWQVYKVLSPTGARNVMLATERGADDYGELQCCYDNHTWDNGTKVYLILSSQSDPKSYSGNDPDAYMLVIRADGYFNIQEQDGYWPDTTPSILGAEDLDIEGFHFPRPDEDGMFYTEEGSEKVFRGCDYETAQKLKNYVVKEGTTKMGVEALYNAESLETLAVPASVTTIEEFAIPDNDLDNFKVICSKGSAAEAYCKENDIPVQLN